MKEFIKKRLNESLNEGRQVGILYHFTKYNNAIYIISDGFRLTSGIQPFVSFTRNKSMTSDTIPAEVRFTIDGNSLSNRYKILPFAHTSAGYGRTTTDEAEERISLTQYPNGVVFKNSLLSIDIKKPDIKTNWDDEESVEPAMLSEYVALIHLLKKEGIPFNIVKNF